MPRAHLRAQCALAYDCFAGSAQNTSFLRDTDLPGPVPKFFFAPVQIKKRNADWGHALFNQTFNAAQLGAGGLEHSGAGLPNWSTVAPWRPIWSSLGNAQEHA